MARLSDAVPPPRRRVGVSTWIWLVGMPMFLGSRVRHSSTTVWAARALSYRRRQKKSFWLASRSGTWPWLTWWAFMTMALSRAWRKISVSRTAGTRPLRSRSESRLPGPTEGSWSGSPTSTSRQSPRRADNRADMSSMSTMDVSSTMTASASSGSVSL